MSVLSKGCGGGPKGETRSRPSFQTNAPRSSSKDPRSSRFEVLRHNGSRQTRPGRSSKALAPGGVTRGDFKALKALKVSRLFRLFLKTQQIPSTRIDPHYRRDMRLVNHVLPGSRNLAVRAEGCRVPQDSAQRGNRTVTGGKRSGSWASDPPAWFTTVGQFVNTRDVNNQ